MQVTETQAEGLKREFRVVVPVTGIDEGIAVRALADVDLVRATAFDRLDGVQLPASNGPVRLAPDALCPPS